MSMVMTNRGMAQRVSIAHSDVAVPVDIQRNAPVATIIELFSGEFLFTNEHVSSDWIATDGMTNINLAIQADVILRSNEGSFKAVVEYSFDGVHTFAEDVHYSDTDTKVLRLANSAPYIRLTVECDNTMALYSAKAYKIGGM